MNIIFSIDGGLGKSIIATAVLKAIKKQYKKANILVSTGYPDVFINNPNVNRIITHVNNSGIYKDFIQNKDAKVFISDPYSTSDYITESKHLIQIWCEMFGIEYNGEMPELFLSKAEKQYFEPFYRLDKPILAIQPNGGAINQPLKYSWVRDIPAPIVEQVIEHYKNDYSIVHIKREDQIIYENTIGALDSFRSIAIMLTMSEKRLLIDSSAMHIATALNLPSVVAWIGTSEKVFGYDMHTNIIANTPPKEYDLGHSYYQRMPLFEDISKIPYNDLNEVFDVNEIIKLIKAPN
jgi:ADP-heptose:LPS heptosyltransferase